MVTKPFQEWQISHLGMGNMRLPTVGERGPVDESRAREIIAYAYEHGVNYFDTAYRYHQGESELVTGRALAEYPRDTWHLATKMPGHMMSYRDGRVEGIGYLTGHKIGSPAEIFSQQLEKCGVDYFDFYLLHNLSESSYDFYTNEELGVVDYLVAQKKAGRIRHLGFSSHGSAETIDRFLNWRKNCFELVQIQLNYLDWTLQDAAKKYEVITRHGLAVVAMEPVRGGRLATLKGQAETILKAARPDLSIASWALRFLQALPNVLVVLSGMSTMEQVTENVELFSNPDPMSEAERETLQKALASIADVVPCTECRYCCEDCPQNLDIPKLISMYNEFNFGNAVAQKSALAEFPNDERPSACVSCGTCAKLCPQGIDIPGVLKAFAAAVA